MKKTALITSCLILLLLGLARDISAQTVQYWDNDGTGTPTSGNWDNSTTNWADSPTLTDSTDTFTNSNFPVFAGGSTTVASLTINVPNAVTCEGLGDGEYYGGVASGAAVTSLTFSGTGSINLPAGAWSIECGATGNNIYIEVPITGPGGFAQHNSGYLYLYGTNTYSGGTTITGGQLTYYDNNASFGTGPITYTGTQSIENSAAGVVTLSNAWVINNAGGVVNFASGNTICSGPWTLETTPQIKDNSATLPLTISGPISGAFGLILQNDNAAVGNAIMTLSGANTYTGQTQIGQGGDGGAVTLSVASINSVANPPQQSSSSLGVPSSAANGVITFGNTASGLGVYNNELIYTGSGETSDRGLSFIGTTGGITIEMDGAGPLVLTGPITITQNGARTLTLQGSSTATNTIAGAIPNSGSGATTFKKAQAGTWVLTGTNTFTGNTTISAGTLEIGGAGRLNSGSYAGTIANSGTLIYNSSDAQTLSGVISGAGTLTDSGTGTLTLSGANTYTGTTTLSAGTINVDKAETVGTSGPLGKSAAANPGSIVLNGGTLQYSSANNADYSGRFNNTAANVPYNIDVNGVSVTYATAALSSSGGALTVKSTAAGGTLTLNAAETYTGATTITSGTLAIGSSGSLDGGSYAPNITDNGGFTYGGSSAQVLSGTFTGTGALTQNGPGSLTLSSATVTYSGATTIGAGSTLYLTASAPTSATSSLNIGAGGILDVSAISSATYTFPNSTSLTATGTSSAAATINGAPGEVINLGSQPMSFTIAPTTFTGDTTQPALVISQSLALSGNVITVNNASGTPLGAGNYVLIQVGSGNTTGTPNEYVTVTGSGLVAGDYATVQVVGGNVVLSVQQPANGNPTWNGNDYANSPNWSDSLNWASGAPNPTGDQVYFANGSSQTPVMDSSYTVYSLTFLAASDILANSGGSVLTVGSGVTNSSGNLQTLALPVQLLDLGGPLVPSQWNTSGGNITVSGVISDNNIGLTESGGNTLTLSGLNTYTGTTTINGATLSVNSVADAPCSIGTGALTIEGGGTLNFTGFSGATARTVSVEGTTTDTINVPGGSSLSFNGQVHSVSDTAAQMLTLTGGGTLNLGGTVDNSGLTMAINQGEVVITKSSGSAAHGLGGGTTTIGTGSAGNSAELQLAGSGSYDLYSGCILTVNSPDGFLDVNGQNDSFSTLTLSGAGPNNMGAMINSATGTTSLLTNAGSAVVLAAPTTIGGSGNITMVSAISGSGMSLTYDGSAILALGGAGTFNGGLTINSGTVEITSGGYTTGGGGTGPVTLNGGILWLSNNTALANTSVTGGAGSVIDIALVSANLWLTNTLNSFVGTFNVNYANTAVNGGQLVVGDGASITPNINGSATWNIAAGSAVDFNVGQTDPATVYLNGFPYASAADGALRLDDSVQSGNVILMGNSEIGNGSSAGASTISGIISSTGAYGFVKMGADPVALTAANTYTGNTIISNGSLILSGSGSINNSANLRIVAGGSAVSTFDVSALASPYNLSASTSLSAYGTASAAAAINGASGGVFNVGSQPVFLSFTPQTFTGDLAHPALNILQGTLSLGGNAFTVSNATATPLGAGAYTLISQASGSVTSSGSYTVTVTGGGLVAGATASIQVVGGGVNLVVSVPTPPHITSVSLTGTSLMISATNGTPNGPYRLMATTNLTIPEINWTPVMTGSYDVNGNVSLTFTINPSTPQQFFSLQNP